MKKLVMRWLLLTLAALVLAVPVFARRTLIPVGQAVGLELNRGGLTVAGFDEDMDGARSAGLQIGDRIVKVDGTPVERAQELREQAARAEGSVELTLERRGEPILARVTVQDGRLGLYVREGITGIGTVTYYDPERGLFATLGHGVSDGAGNLAELTGGTVYPAEITSVQKGKSGTPGMLRGAFRTGEPLGTLERNTRSGIFGTSKPFRGTPLPIAEAGEIHTGKAVILSDLEGGSPREYEVQILQVFTGEKAEGRNLLLRVTDPALLETTGGIVQGMSGSPILQDGRLVGAVTHVLVNNPTKGYGIFIENMLSAAA